MDVHKLATEVNDLGPISFKKTSAAARARRANEGFVHLCLLRICLLIR